MSKKQIIGKQGEDAVAYALQKRGFVLLMRNEHTRYGEIDIMARHEGVIHVIEVKTRTSNAFGFASETLTIKKFTKMKKSYYEVAQTGTLPSGVVQFDFAAVTIEQGKAYIEWFWNIGNDDIAP